MYKVHDLTSYTMSESYDITQSCDDIKSGDVLIVKDGIAILMQAWPTMIVGESKVFHQYFDGYDFDNLTDSGNTDYRPQVKEIKTNPQALIERASNPLLG